KNQISEGVKLKKSVMLIFQAGEEGKAGAKIISESPHFYNKKFEAIFALHLDPAIDEGIVACSKGALSYQNINMDIEIIGKGCHGAQPFKGIDSILVGSKLVESYQSIVSRNIQPSEPVIITIGSFKAGTVRNIIPEKVDILGTIRLTNVNLIPFIKERIEAINKGFEVAYGVKINMKFQPYYPPIINCPNLFDLLKKVTDKEQFNSNGKFEASEDFSFYLQNGNPGLMFLLGTKNIEKNYVYPLHNSKFDFDPNALKLGFEIFKNLLIELKIFN
ncbi:MAG: M20 metallopeptidase family protein, partial [Fusobacteriaceae bacterium]